MMKILYVEDETELRTTLEEMLEEEGFEVATALNGSEGLRAMKQFNPDIVITDWLMPVMNGMEMIRLMRAEGSRFIRTPVIVVSAYAAQSEIDEALAIGACRYLTKPVDFDTLLACISDIGPQPEDMEPIDCGCRTPLPTMTNGD